MKLVTWNRKVLAVGAIVVTVGLVAIGIFIFLLQQQDAVTNCDSSDDLGIPVVAEFGSDYVVLHGSDQVLRVGDIYQYANGASQNLSIRLYSVSSDDATFIVQSVSESGEAGLPTRTYTYRCKAVINEQDKTFRPRFEAVLVQPMDFAPRWKIGEYTEYVARYEAISPDDQTHVIMSIFANNGPYVVRIDLYRYENEKRAIEAADESKLEDISRLTDSTQYQSQTSESVEGCDRAQANCAFEGRYDRFWLHVAMHVQGGSIVIEPGPRITVQDWHDIMKLIETKLITGTLSDFIRLRVAVVDAPVGHRRAIH